jgi:hypothetical protein|tara:strand:+ start:2304 stop:2441 length:138 start_codon:yes stop_codon:yes gene_type:complete
VGRVTATTIKEAAYKYSGNGKCWWIERYIKNSFYKKITTRPQRRR